MKQGQFILSVTVLILLSLTNCKEFVKRDELLKSQADNARLVNEISNLKTTLSALQDERDRLQNESMKLSNDNKAMKNVADSTKTELGKLIAGLKSVIKKTIL